MNEIRTLVYEGVSGQYMFAFREQVHKHVSGTVRLTGTRQAKLQTFAAIVELMVVCDLGLERR